MQYWIFFHGGVGGDGFANLLEHANNMHTLDGNLLWRTRRSKVNPDKVAFYAPKFTSDGRFLRSHDDADFDLSKIDLDPNYVRLVEEKLNTVISVHPWWYNHDPRFKHWNFLERDQHKIVVFSKNKQRIYDDFFDKNGTFTEEYKNNFKLGLDRNPNHDFTNLGMYRTRIDIDRVWEDWDYLNYTLTKIGIDLDRKHYEDYLDVSKRRKI